jgi:DNA polymerase-3 subunit beta
LPRKEVITVKVNVEKLRQALELLEPVVPRKTSLPACIYVRLGEGKAVATDLEAAVTVSGLGDSEEGVCLPYDTLTKLLASVPGRETATITVDGKKATLTAGRTQATLAALPVEDFPPIPDLKPEHEAAVDGDALVRALTSVLPAAAGKDDTRPVLQSVCLTLGESPEVAAADGFRLAWEPVPVKLPGKGSLLIPTGSVRALAHLWRYAPKPPQLEGVANSAQLATARRLVRLGYSKDLLGVSFGEVSLLTQLVKGTFPSYRQLIPEAGAPSVTFDAGDLVRAVKGMLKIAKEGSGIFRLYWGDSELRVEARAEDLGTTSTAIPAVCQGEGKIAFNAAYLLDYLKGKEGTVTFASDHPSHAGLFSYRDTPNLALMPMFVQWEGEPVATPPPAAEATPATEEPETPSVPAEPKKAKARRKKGKK